MSYLALKHLHVLCVALTITSFSLRSLWMFQGSTLLQKKWVKIAPHIIDTILLGSAVGMLVVASMNPLQQPWLIAKIIGLVVYVLLGTVALKRGKTRKIRLFACAGSLMTVTYIVGVALSKQPLSPFFLLN